MADMLMMDVHSCMSLEQAGDGGREDSGTANSGKKKTANCQATGELPMPVQP